MPANGREFLLAIKESTHTIFDEDAVDYLDTLREGVSRGADAQNLRDDARDAAIFFEGMLRGVQLKLRRAAAESKSKLNEMGFLSEDGPKLPDA